MSKPAQPLVLRGGPTLPQALKLFKARKRKLKIAKDEAGEIRFLNIVAMVDVLTILLIFLLKSVSVATTTVPASANMTLPFSTTEELPVGAVKVLVAKDRILVEDQAIVQVKYGAALDQDVAPDNPYHLPKLQSAMENWIRLVMMDKKAEVNEINLEILADKDTPYALLMQVIYTASKARVELAGITFAFTKYRLMAMRANQ